MGKKMHANTRQMGRDLGDRASSHTWTAQGSLTRAAFLPIASPLHPQSIEMADAHRNRDLPLGDLFEHHTAWALWVLLKHLPHEGHLNSAKLSPRIKGWTSIFSEGTLAQGEGHDFILLKTCFRMKCAPSLLEGKGHFYPQENQRVQLKNSKPCQKYV